MSEGWLTLFRMSSLVRLLMVASSNDHSSNNPLVKHTGPTLKQITATMKTRYMQLCRSELTSLGDGKSEKKKDLNFIPYSCSLPLWDKSAYEPSGPLGRYSSLVSVPQSNWKYFCSDPMDVMVDPPPPPTLAGGDLHKKDMGVCQKF